MKIIKKLFSFLNSRGFSCAALIMTAFGYVFVKNATWAHTWIPYYYPLGDKFVPTLLTAAAVSGAAEFAYLIYRAFAGENRNRTRLTFTIDIIHILFTVFGIIAFVLGTFFLFDLTGLVSAETVTRALTAAAPDLIYVVLTAAGGLALVFSRGAKNAFRAITAWCVICGIVIPMIYFSNNNITANMEDNMITPKFTSKNLFNGAELVSESLKKGEKADASNLLDDTGKCWTAQCPAGNPSDGQRSTNNSVAEFKLAEKCTFNTAVIEEIGNEAQYFRLQALIDGEWKTVYRSEKIQSLRVCSFDAVTTDTIRLSIDKFRDENTPVQIRSLKLFNEPKRENNDFEVTVYQRLDGDKPTEILAKGDEYVKNYARYYDTYTTVIVFGAINWDNDGNMLFGNGGEEEFAREITALRRIVDMRENKNHKVKIIVTGLADGAWGDGHNGVNVYMALHWEKIADKITELVDKYNFDGVDIDWEYPASYDDWKVFDSFVQKLSADMKKTNPDAIISAALSAQSLGLSQATYDCIDQIQFMAYDGNDHDGFQSSLEQAESGLAEFVSNGANIEKIIIGIAAYGRPVNSSPYWASWRTLESANYWDNKYCNVEDGDQIYDGTFCSPALAGDKTAYALLTGAGGVMVFRLACDKLPNDPNSVVGGIENALNRYFETH